MAEYNKDLLCKDCKYAKASWLDRVLQLGFGFYCTNPKSWNEPRYDPVCGRENKGYFNRATGMRGSYSECGPEGKMWCPKDSKKVFLFLKNSN